MVKETQGNCEKSELEPFVDKPIDMKTYFLAIEQDTPLSGGKMRHS